MIFVVLLGVPANYRRRLTKADWIQWASSKRWIDQQQAMDTFIKNLIAEWNLINLIVGAFPTSLINSRLVT